ncbi:SAV_915 family protein [Amycolatopsis sp. CA-230715]|uniref:SAV_915 family protein n=1 Tax=Amycolatopsis sp. CA-230715 TaxID=2745196 RepID=UPI001C012D10|nr:SAV_915 family protein [Amycolatopsis sp. CA-230715]
MAVPEQTPGEIAEPTVFFLPSVPGRGDDGRPALALKPLDDGRLALPLYTALDRLVAGCGDRQPWVAVLESKVEQVFRDSGADVAIVDAELSDDARWGDDTEPVGLGDYREAVAGHEQDAKGDSHGY